MLMKQRRYSNGFHHKRDVLHVKVGSGLLEGEARFYECAPRFSRFEACHPHSSYDYASLRTCSLDTAG